MKTIKLILSIMVITFSGVVIANTNSNSIDSRINEYTKNLGLYDNTNLILLKELVRNELTNPQLKIRPSWITKILNYKQPFEAPMSEYPSVSRYLEADLIKFVLSRKDVKINPNWVEMLLKIDFRPHVKDALVEYVFSRSTAPLKGKWFLNFSNSTQHLNALLKYPHFNRFLLPAMDSLGVQAGRYNIDFLKIAMTKPYFAKLDNRKATNIACPKALL